MKRAIVFTVLCALSALISCYNGLNDVYNESFPGEVVTLVSAVQTGGSSGTVSTTGLILTFDIDPATLTADDITVTGAAKGALSGTGQTRSLSVSGITVADGGTVSITISNPVGYSIKGSPMTAVVYKGPPVLTYHANGGTAGSVPATPAAYSIGQTVTVLGNTGNLAGAIIRDGIKQRFIGWNTDPSAATALYVAGNTFNINADTTLYAIYTTGNSVLRKVGPAGGWVFYDAGSTQSWGRYLEAWTEDETGTNPWKTDTTSTPGTSTAIGTGYANTYTYMTGTSHPAAAVVQNATHGGKTGWFLPSWLELQKMWDNLARGTNDDEGVASYTKVGDLATNYRIYWCSSEYVISTYYLAYTVDLYDGSLASTNKDDTYARIRAVRAF